jgi:hypothetical protein
MASRRHLLAALAAALLVLPLVAPAVAAPPPEPLCGTCSLVDGEHDADGVRFGGDTSVTVELFANGSSRWTERVAVRRGAGRLAANDTLRRALVERAFDDDYHAARHRRTATDSRVGDGSLVTTYRVPDLATRSMGVLVVDDDFGRAGYRNYVYLGAARATVVAPEGYELAAGPGDGAATTNATAVVWTGDAEGHDYGPAIEDRFSFAPQGTALAGLRADGAAALDDGPPTLSTAAALALFPTLFVGGTSALYVGWRTGRGRSIPTGTLVAVSLVAGLLGVAATVGVALLRWQSSLSLGPLPVVLVPVVGLAALGYCAGGGGRTRSLVGALAVLPWVVTVALALNAQLLASDATTTALVALGALAVTFLGVPGYLAGRRYAPASGPGER